MSCVIRVKDSTVNLAGLSTQALFAIVTCHTIYKRHNAQYMVITSVNDSDLHSKESRHYRGDAFDLSVRSLLDVGAYATVRYDIASALGYHFDVILESYSSPETGGETIYHIHVEYNQRKPK